VISSQFLFAHSFVFTTGFLFFLCPFAKTEKMTKSGKRETYSAFSVTVSATKTISLNKPGEKRCCYSTLSLSFPCPFSLSCKLKARNGKLLLSDKREDREYIQQMDKTCRTYYLFILTLSLVEKRIRPEKESSRE
jgi:hypothetical protein